MHLPALNLGGAGLLLVIVSTFYLGEGSQSKESERPQSPFRSFLEHLHLEKFWYKRKAARSQPAANHKFGLDLLGMLLREPRASGDEQAAARRVSFAFVTPGVSLITESTRTALRTQATERADAALKHRRLHWANSPGVA